MKIDLRIVFLTLAVTSLSIMKSVHCFFFVVKESDIITDVDENLTHFLRVSLRVSFITFFMINYISILSLYLTSLNTKSTFEVLGPP